MRAIVIATAALSVFVSVQASAQSSTYQRGYVRRDGTYVAPTMRTNPNSTIQDNYSSRPNINPYNGRIGTANPYPTYRTTPQYQPTPAYKPYTYTPPKRSF